MVRRHRRRRRRRRSGDRGAALVEVAIVAPLLMTLLVGMSEVALAVNTSQTVVTAARSAARVSSSAGNERLADHDALATLATTLYNLENEIEYIAIFRPERDGTMPSVCATTSVVDVCNRYTAADLDRNQADFAGTDTCDAASPDRSWCPTDRAASQLSDLGWLGVQVAVNHRSIAPMVGDRLIVETTVMRLEPDLSP